MPCKKCNDTGWYMYDLNHGTKCEHCCTHNKGWWTLTKQFKGYIEGTDNRCCKAGCGQMYRDLGQ